MSAIYGVDETEKRKLAFIYRHSDIEKRYSVIDDFSQPRDAWDFIPKECGRAFPSLEERMEVYNRETPVLAIRAVTRCIEGYIMPGEITHLITVSCTGMSAPGLDLQVAETIGLSPGIFRTSVNFMGCYAAVHALKLAKLICGSTPNANVIIVAAELCTIHFQQEYTQDNVASSLLFADGCAAVLVSNKLAAPNSLSLDGFYSHVAYKGKKDMAWELSSKGFLMTLSGYIPYLVEEDISGLVSNALQHYGQQKNDITHWCVHPGGKKIIDVIEKQLQLDKNALCPSRQVLAEYGNMSSPTILFVLKEMMEKNTGGPANIFGVAFGPGLTMETFMAHRQ
jgi:predicted naringenin-chalcone synthase